MHWPWKCIISTSFWRLYRKMYIKINNIKYLSIVFKRLQSPLKSGVWRTTGTLRVSKPESRVLHFSQKTAAGLYKVGSGYKPFELRHIEAGNKNVGRRILFFFFWDLDVVIPMRKNYSISLASLTYHSDGAGTALPASYLLTQQAQSSTVRALESMSGWEG